MKRITLCFFLMIAGLSSYSQVKTILLDNQDHITKDSSAAVAYGVYGILAGDSLYTFKKFDFDGVLLTSGSFKDDKLQVPEGKFVYYGWITPNNNNENSTYEINGKERYIELTGNYSNGVRVGRWITSYPNGKLKQIVTFYQGIPHGAFQFYDANGKLNTQGLYRAGKKNGKWTLNGGKQEDIYDNGKLISSLKGKKLREQQTAGKNIN